VKICVIAGWARSGSSLLAKMMGQYEGMFDAGELIQWWMATSKAGWRCGCGAEVVDCAVWSAVMAAVPQSPRAGPSVASFSAEGVVQRFRDLPEIWWQQFGGHSEKVENSRQVLAAIYHSIQSVTGARVVVDSSKSPAWVELAQSLDNADVRVVHLVRDPRATAFSHTRMRGTPTGIDGQKMRQMGAATSAMYWTVNHGTLATATRRSVGRERYLRVHYEDLMASPRFTVEQIMEFLDEPTTNGPFIDQRTLTMAPTHNLAGNAMRFDSGRVRLSADDQWSNELPRSTRLVTMAIAGSIMPLLGPTPTPTTR